MQGGISVRHSILVTCIGVAPSTGIFSTTSRSIVRALALAGNDPQPVASGPVLSCMRTSTANSISFWAYHCSASFT